MSYSALQNIKNPNMSDLDGDSEGSIFVIITRFTFGLKRQEEAGSSSSDGESSGESSEESGELNRGWGEPNDDEQLGLDLEIVGCSLSRLPDAAATRYEKGLENPKKSKGGSKKKLKEPRVVKGKEIERVEELEEVEGSSQALVNIGNMKKIG
ncbi:hypothetical protein BDV93DRAFT_513683 [Ceratobasidium sp. AG-I]|nr:hypothetical protein BDV93DRAFT_513683 [Ceratobasidium sp. AG-I]